MKYFITFVLILSCLLGQAQISAGVRDSIFSKILNEQRQLMVYLPKGVKEGKDSSMRYPVLYVLDGNTHFLSVAGMVDQLSDQGGNAVIPKMIVVCILNTNRTRDLTPYHIDSSELLPADMAKETGGGENFTRCIAEEIIPYINAHYPVTEYRGLVGHSFGGIFALNVLAKHKELFEDYIVIDPSTWYDERKFSTSVLDSLKKGNYSNKSLFIAIANTANEKDTSKVQLMKSSSAEHEKSIIEFCNKAKLMKKSGIQFNYEYYPNDDHSSVPLIATYNGLRNIFKDFRFSFEYLFEKDFSPLTSIPSFYEKLSKKVRHTMKPSSELIELCDLYYSFYKDEKRKSETRLLYKKLYPDKANAFYSKSSN